MPLPIQSFHSPIWTQSSKGNVLSYNKQDIKTFFTSILWSWQNIYENMSLSWSFLLLCHVTRPSHTAFPFQVNEPDRLWVCPRYVAAFSSLLHHFLIVTRLTGYHVIFFWQVFLPIFYICYCLTFLNPPFFEEKNEVLLRRIHRLKRLVWLSGFNS